MLVQMTLFGFQVRADPIIDVPQDFSDPELYCAGWYRNIVTNADGQSKHVNCEETCRHIIHTHKHFHKCRKHHEVLHLDVVKRGGEHELLHYCPTQNLKVKTYDCKVGRWQDDNMLSPGSPQFYGNNIVGAGVLGKFCWPWMHHKNNFQCLCVVELHPKKKDPTDPTDPNDPTDPDDPIDDPPTNPDDPTNPDEPTRPDDPNPDPGQDLPDGLTGPPPPEEALCPSCMASTGNSKLDCYIHRFTRGKVDICGNSCGDIKPTTTRKPTEEPRPTDEPSDDPRPPPPTDDEPTDDPKPDPTTAKPTEKPLSLTGAAPASAKKMKRRKKRSSH